MIQYVKNYSAQVGLHRLSSCIMNFLKHFYEAQIYYILINWKLNHAYC